MSSSSSTTDTAVAVIGTGLVGSAFVDQLLSFPKPNHFHLVSLTSSKLHLFDPAGLNIAGGPAFAASWKSALAASDAQKPDIAQILRELAALVTPGRRVVLVDNTSADEVAAVYPDFLRAGVHVVTPNKKAFSGAQTLYDALVAASFEGGARVLNEATVGAGLPVLSTLKDLVATGDKVRRIEGVLSGTMSYILNEFSPISASPDAPAFSAVVASARAQGFTEPHPGDDLNGADVARKLAILARLAGLAPPDGFRSVSTASLVPPQLEGVRSGDAFVARLPELDDSFAETRRAAAEAGEVLRYVGVIDVASGEIKADLLRYPVTHPFATSLGGSDNIIMFHTERYGARPLIIQGAGAGAAVTAMGVMSDLLKLI